MVYVLLHLFERRDRDEESRFVYLCASYRLLGLCVLLPLRKDLVCFVSVKKLTLRTITKVSRRVDLSVFPSHEARRSH
jgi:hypothetical protein